MISNERFGLIIAEKAKYTDLLIYLRDRINRG